MAALLSVLPAEGVGRGREMVMMGSFMTDGLHIRRTIGCEKSGLGGLTVAVASPLLRAMAAGGGCAPKGGESAPEEDWQTVSLCMRLRSAAFALPPPAAVFAAEGDWAFREGRGGGGA